MMQGVEGHRGTKGNPSSVSVSVLWNLIRRLGKLCEHAVAKEVNGITAIWFTEALCETIDKTGQKRFGQVVLS